MANAKNKTRRKILVFSAIGLVLIGLAVVAIFRKREVIIAIQTEKVGRRSLTELVVANGKIQPVVQVVISPEVAGEIIELPVREGQVVKKGQLLVQIKPDNYKAGKNSAEAIYKSALAGINQAKAELAKAEMEFKRHDELFKDKLVSDSVYQDIQTLYEVAKLRYESSNHQSDQAKFALDKAIDDLAKTTIISPIDGTVTRLKSQLGERVLGTSFNMGTEIMTIANLEDMEARVDIGEIDVVLIAVGQNARLEVDAFKDSKFTGTVTEIANASKGLGALNERMGGGGGGGQQQEATKFEVKIRIQERELFRPGMSVMAEVETRYRTNVLCVPIQSVTTRMPKKEDEKNKQKAEEALMNSVASATTNGPVPVKTNSTRNAEGKKPGEAPKPIEVVFAIESDRVKMLPVKRGISDDAYVEITEGVSEGQEVVSGGYKAINRELEDGKRIKKGGAEKEKEKIEDRR